MALRSPDIFRIRISGYDIDTDILRTDLRVRLPATVYGPLTNTVYALFQAVFPGIYNIKFMN